jgi:adenylosuccinate synthase
MSVTIIQDLRWGDGGKGKVSTYLSQPDFCDVSGRFLGADNAGHEYVIRVIEIIDGVIRQTLIKISTNLFPAGGVYKGVDIVMGRGMHINPDVLVKEGDKIQAAFQSDPFSRLILAPEAHFLFEGHRKIDRAMEERQGKSAIGSTKKGVAYGAADKALRVGMRLEELKKPFAEIQDRYGKMLTHWGERYGVTLNDEEQSRDLGALREMKERELDGNVQDMTPYWRKKFAQKARIVVEGAQGSLLNVDSSGYPYVTSTATTTAGHLQGGGIPVRELTSVVGVIKACYDTRVGAGPMEFEMEPERASKFRELGDERGRTTGRDRRIGELHLEDAARRAWEESTTHVALLKGDLLDNETEFKVVIGKSGSGEPEYKHFKGWPTPIHGLTNFEQFPDNAKEYFNYLREFIRQYMGLDKLPMYIGTGQEHDAIAIA